MKKVSLFLVALLSLILGGCGHKNEAPKLIGMSDEFVVSVDYSKTFQQMITEGGYTFKDEEITENHFSIDPKMSGKKVDLNCRIFFVNPDKQASSEEIIKAMDSLGYRPAGLPELLSLRITRFDMPHETWIVALATVWQSGNGYWYTPELSPDKVWPSLHAYNYSYKWASFVGFLAIRK